MTIAAGNTKPRIFQNEKTDKLLSNPANGPMIACFAMSCAASRAHSEMAKHALAEYGSQGATISGCVRDHFPSHVKGLLRQLAKTVHDWSAEAFRVRPARMRLETVRNIGSSVASRDGAGFYGAQPHIVRQPADWPGFSSYTLGPKA